MIRGFSFGMILGLLLLVSCGALTYRYFGLDLPPECYEKGKLLGKQGKDGWADLPFTTCQPDPNVRGKCIVMEREEFFDAKVELEQCRADLSDCQRNK